MEFEEKVKQKLSFLDDIQKNKYHKISRLVFEELTDSVNSTHNHLALGLHIHEPDSIQYLQNRIEKLKEELQSYSDFITGFIFIMVTNKFFNLEEFREDSETYSEESFFYVHSFVLSLFEVEDINTLDVEILNDAITISEIELEDQDYYLSEINLFVKGSSLAVEFELAKRIKNRKLKKGSIKIELPERKLNWQLDGLEVAELTKALIKSNKVIGHKSEKEVFDEVMKFFNVEFDKREKLQTIKQRTKDKTPFLDQLTHSLNNWIGNV